MNFFSASSEETHTHKRTRTLECTAACRRVGVLWWAQGQWRWEVGGSIPRDTIKFLNAVYMHTSIRSEFKTWGGKVSFLNVDASALYSYYSSSCSDDLLDTFRVEVWGVSSCCPHQVSWWRVPDDGRRQCACELLLTQLFNFTGTDSTCNCCTSDVCRAWRRAPL